MRILSNELSIDFMAKATHTIVGSLVVLLLCVGSMIVQGMNFGLDFTGGIVVEARYPAGVDIHQVRGALATAGFNDAQTQHFGSAREVLVRIPPREGKATSEVSQTVGAALATLGQVEVVRVEFVGPQVGEELLNDGGLAVLFALLGILVYVALRFEWRLAIGAIAATVHDVVFCVGMFSLLRIEFDLTVLAAVLAVIGYSVNDTVVVFDRIRENFRRMRRDSAYEVINASINQTMSRTIMTSLTVLLVVVALYAFGGPAMHGFSLTMIAGVLIGTYSSVYIASATAMRLGLSRQDLLPKAREVDDRP